MAEKQKVTKKANSLVVLGIVIGLFVLCSGAGGFGAIMLGIFTESGETDQSKDYLT